MTTKKKNPKNIFNLTNKVVLDKQSSMKTRLPRFKC